MKHGMIYFVFTAKNKILGKPCNPLIFTRWIPDILILLRSRIRKLSFSPKNTMFQIQWPRKNEI